MNQMKAFKIVTIVVLVTMVAVLVFAYTNQGSVFNTASNTVSNAGNQSISSLPSTPNTTIPKISKVTSLAVNPPELDPGIQAIITAKLNNDSAVPDNYETRVRVDDISEAALPTFLDTPQTTIAPGDTKTLSVTLTVNTPGTYKVTWDSQTAQFTVKKPDTATVAPANATAPDFSGIDVVTNKKITLSDFKGQAILLNFVNYGCDPSVNQKVGSELLLIRDLKAKRTDFAPVSVFCGCCPPDVLRSFAQQNNLSWPWILDSDNSIVAKYGNYLRKFGYPTLIFIDKDGKIQETAGYSDAAKLNSSLDNLNGLSATKSG